jgi:hypothetical protein
VFVFLNISKPELRILRLDIPFILAL